MTSRGKPLGPGKTAPRLIADLLDYDPRYHLRNGKNLLADPAPKFRGEHFPRKGSGDCRHILMRKDNQTLAPTSPDEQPDASTYYVVATYCTRCRCHFEISVDFRQQYQGQVPCKLSDESNPIHHLQLIQSRYPPSSRSSSFESLDAAQEEQHRFVCSGIKCPVIVNIEITQPRLSKQLLLLFHDAKKLQTRGEQVKAEDPGRYEGLEPLRPVQVLSNIRAYLKDAKDQAPRDNKTDLKRIAKRNKKYVLAFADECDDLFNYLGFTTIEEKGSDDEINYFWQLPVINEDNEKFIDDVMVELEVLISERPPQEMRLLRASSIPSPIPAMKDIERSIGYFGFSTRSRHVDLTHVEHPYYASLGAVDAFPDDLLTWAYMRQRRCDPQNKPYYLDCLQDLAKGRGSSDLEMKVVEDKSLGELGLHEIEEAYKLLSLDPNSIEGDDHIIGIYKSRIEAAPRQKDEARRCLKIIGEARNSDKIKEVANDTTMSYKEACETLGITEGFEDMEMIFSVATSMASDGASRALMGQALRAVGKQQGHWGLLRQARGMQGAIEFDEAVGEAYAQLQISDRTCSDDTVLQYYMHVRDNATDQSRRNAYKEAVCTIAEQRESLFLMRKADDPNAVVEPTPSTADQPVGLANIGNTCYLNSLLQFLYTINSIREVVTNFDKYRIDLQSPNVDEDIKKRLPNGLPVKKMEVVKAQKFVKELQSLFEQMKKASTQSVAPTKQLVELTLFSNAAEAGWEAERQRKQSISTSLPNISNVLRQTEPVQAPDGPPTKVPLSRSETNNASPHVSSPATPDEDIVMVDKPAANNDGDNTSESTLVGDELPPYDEPAGEVLGSSSASEDMGPKQSEAGDADQHNDDDVIMVNGMTGEDATATAVLEIPPPMPPRNKSGLSIQTNGNGSNAAIDTEKISFGTQQDVTEVIGNVVWRLQCAIKATSIEEGSGVQQDPVGNTLNGSTNVYSRKPTGWEVKIDPWKALFAYPVTPPLNGVRDIYEALDASLDLQKVGNLLQYRSIVKLPPILQIQIQRTHFNKVTGEGKNDNVVEFPETIYLDRYMDSDDPTLQKRRHDAWNWKSKLSKLEARRAVLKSTDFTEAGFDIPDALKATQKYLRDLEEANVDGVKVSPTLTHSLEGRIAEVNAEVDRLEGEMSNLKEKLNNQFSDMTKYEYQLRAVFIHRGQMGGGHYWIYLYDAKSDIWRKYNDEHVSRVVDRNRVFSPQNFDDGTPYFLGYVRSSSAQDLVDAVVRDVQPISTPMDMSIDDIEDAPAASVRHVEFAPKPIAPKELPGWTSPGLARPVRYPNNLWSDTPAMKDANGKDWEL